MIFGFINLIFFTLVNPVIASASDVLPLNKKNVTSTEHKLGTLTCRSNSGEISFNGAFYESADTGCHLDAFEDDSSEKYKLTVNGQALSDDESLPSYSGQSTTSICGYKIDFPGETKDHYSVSLIALDGALNDPGIPGMSRTLFLLNDGNVTISIEKANCVFKPEQN